MKNKNQDQETYVVLEQCIYDNGEIVLDLYRHVGIKTVLSIGKDLVIWRNHYLNYLNALKDIETITKIFNIKKENINDYLKEEK